MLGNSGYENDPSIANADVWNTFSEGDHIYLRFKATHRTQVMGKTVAFSEMLVPVSVDRSPPYILVRKGGDIRAFCKYDCATSTALQDEIRAWSR